MRALDAAYPDEPDTTKYPGAQLTHDSVYELARATSEKIENWISYYMRKLNPNNDSEISKQIRGGPDDKIKISKLVTNRPSLLRNFRIVTNKSMTPEEAEKKRHLAKDKTLNGPKYERQQAMKTSGLRFLIAHVDEVKSFI